MAGLEGDLPHDLACGFLGVGIADVGGYAVVVTVSAVERCLDRAGSAAQRVELRCNILSFGDEHETVVEDAPTVQRLFIRQVALRKMQRQIRHWTAVVVADDSDSLNMKVVVAADEGIDRNVHVVAPVEKDGGTWPPRGACPSGAWEKWAESRLTSRRSGVPDRR